MLRECRAVGLCISAVMIAFPGILQVNNRHYSIKDYIKSYIWGIVLECSKALQKSGEQLTEVSFYDELNSAPSGGTLATVFHVLGDRTRLKASLGFDPLLKTLSGEKSTTRFIAKNPSFIGYSSEHKCFTTPFVMAMVMANCVRRSNALNNYSPKLVYK